MFRRLETRAAWRIMSRVAFPLFFVSGPFTLVGCGSGGSKASNATSTSVVDNGTGVDATTSVARSAAETTDASQTASASEANGASKPAASKSDDAVAVVFDAPKGEPRPIHETSQAISAPTDTLAMDITGLNYRGVVCGFSLHGDAPASPVTIRLHGETPSGPFDSGKLKVSWTSLDAVDVNSDSGADGRWNFSSEAHVDRSATGWVISVGGVTGGDDNDETIVPTHAACELQSAKPVFTPKTGPVGYWAGYASV